MSKWSWGKIKEMQRERCNIKMVMVKDKKMQRERCNVKMVMVKDKKMQRERCNVNQNQICTLAEKDKNKLPVAFEEFEVVYTFFGTFFFSL